MLFHYGAYHSADVEQTEIAVVAYSVGLIGLLAIKVLAPGYYAQQNIRTPVKIAILVLIATQVMNLIFVPLFAHAGLALSISVAATFNAMALLVGLMCKRVYQPQPGWLKFTAKILTALIAMGVCLHLLSVQIDWFSLQSAPLVRIGALGAVLAVSGIVYLVALWLVGIKKRDFRRAPSL